MAGACSGGGGKPKPTTTPANTLPDLARSHRIWVGVGTSERKITGLRYQNLVTDNFTSISPMNVFKWETTEPERGRYDFSQADARVALAAAHNMRVRACCLAWSIQNPGWLTKANLSRAEAAAILRAHILAEVGHFKGKVAEWDVVNEPYRTGPGGRVVAFANPWTKAMGIGYIAQALRWAHEADPDALLFINGVGNDGPGAHFNAWYRLVRQLKSSGVPLHGIGMEMHRSGSHPTPAEAYDAMQKFAALGLRVEITELDFAQRLPASAEALQSQAVAFRQMTATCLRVAACTGVTFWGANDSDRYASLFRTNRGAQTMFDMASQPKPAYTAVLDAMRSTPIVPNRLSSGQPAR
jgi:endo-1,4-beta-xylanase